MGNLTHLRRNEAGIRAALGVLGQTLGPRFQTGKSVREQHGHTTTLLTNQPPDGVAFVENAEEVAEVVRVCAQYRVPVIPFGAGTSLEGHVNAPGGGISIDFAGMNRVLRIYPEDLMCVVEPGVTRMALNRELRDQGLFFPIDPGADASLGGMAATNASGTNAVRYGTMRDNVIALKAVMADGTVVKTAARTAKTSAGYDLTRLLIGSEGTLGVITELTLRLRGIPEAMSAARCSFASVEGACEAVMATIQCGVPVARIELLDAASVGAVNAYSGLDLPVTPLLLLEFHGSEASVAEQAETFGEIAGDCGGSGFAWTTRTEERNALWQARHDAYWAIRAMRPGTEGLSTDVCVPISRLAEAVTRAGEKAAELGFEAPILGHVGDGNFHVILLIDQHDPAEVARCEEYTDWLAEMAIGMDGTCTGEHGIGQGKMAYLTRELGKATGPMAAIKRALDPENILNPGKIVDP